MSRRPSVQKEIVSLVENSPQLVRRKATSGADSLLLSVLFKQLAKAARKRWSGCWWWGCGLAFLCDVAGNLL